MSEPSCVLPLPAGESLDLETTLRCGQVFRWRRAGDGWLGAHAGAALRLESAPDGVRVAAAEGRADAAAVARFLGLAAPLAPVHARLARDPVLAPALQACAGLRLLRQDPWECLLGFLCSQNSNIPRIEGCLETLARRWGRVVRWPEGNETALLPSPGALAEAGAEALRGAGLGYRAPYVAASAAAVAGGLDLAALRILSYEEALAELLSLPGVGRKVADCVLLFSLDQPAAFPVDVWVRRALHAHYGPALRRFDPALGDRSGGPLSAGEYAGLAAFARRCWGAHAGYAQQCLFHAARLGLAGGGRRQPAGGSPGGP